MSELVKILKEQTQSLKVQYIEKTKEWAVKEFNSLRELAVKYQNFRFEDIKAGKISRFAYGEMQKKYHKLPHYIVNPNGKVEQHIESTVKYAELHYESSILKLAARIEKKV